MESEIPTKAVPPHLLSPHTLLEGKYRILSVIGSGGMATVYLAEHEVLAERVAVKILDRLPAESCKDLQRFKYEAQTLQRIAHPNVVRVHSFGLTDGNPYMVMEYIDGKPLDKELKENGRMELGRVLELFKGVCSGLQAAHDEQIIHRDLKPGNILVSNSTVKLVDFGIAKLASDANVQQQFTATGVLTGTPFYMSPERCKSLPEDIRSDIYSMGCVLFECLTGQPPFTGESALSILSQHLSTELRIPDNFRSSCPIWRVIRKCMAKDPADRYATVAQLASDLNSLSLDQEKDPLITTARKPVRKGSLTTAFVLAALAAVSAICIGTTTVKTTTTEKHYYQLFSTTLELPPRPPEISQNFYTKVATALKANPREERYITDALLSEHGDSQTQLVSLARARWFAYKANRATIAGDFQTAESSYSSAIKALQCSAPGDYRDLALADVLTRKANLYYFLNEPEKAKPLFAQALKVLRVPTGNSKKELLKERRFSTAVTLLSKSANLYQQAKMVSPSDLALTQELKQQGRDNVREAREILANLSQTLLVSDTQLDEIAELSESLFPGSASHHSKDLQKVLKLFEKGESEESQ